MSWACLLSLFPRCSCGAHRFLLILSWLQVGNWRQEQLLTQIRLTLIYSQIKNQKRKGVIRESKNRGDLTNAPERTKTYSEEEDHVRYKYFPRCKRCSQRKNNFPCKQNKITSKLCKCLKIFPFKCFTHIIFSMLFMHLPSCVNTFNKKLR